jgi:hypothetical protein
MLGKSSAGKLDGGSSYWSCRERRGFQSNRFILYCPYYRGFFAPDFIRRGVETDARQ